MSKNTNSRSIYVMFGLFREHSEDLTRYLTREVEEFLRLRLASKPPGSAGTGPTTVRELVALLGAEPEWERFFAERIGEWLKREHNFQDDLALTYAGYHVFCLNWANRFNALSVSAFVRRGEPPPSLNSNTDLPFGLGEAPGYVVG